MYCSNCGTQLPDDANFCLKCGKPQKENVSFDESKYETCEIVFEWVSKGTLGMGATKMRFWAKAIGAEGIYNAGRSDVFSGWQLGPDASETKQVNALNQFIDRLASNGWEPLTRGECWFSYRFQRRDKNRFYGKSISG
jgi:hypothetical protein